MLQVKLGTYDAFFVIYTVSLIYIIRTKQDNMILWYTWTKSTTPKLSNSHFDASFIHKLASFQISRPLTWYQNLSSLPAFPQPNHHLSDLNVVVGLLYSLEVWLPVEHPRPLLAFSHVLRRWLSI